MNKKSMPQSEDEWKKKLSPKQFHVLREKGTEMPFRGKYVHNKDKGMYVCAACGSELFSSDTKFESGTGWPSFYDVASKGNVAMREDNSHGMHRIEVTCAKCGGHLGHVFDAGPETIRRADGPKPTGKRFCINSCALDFKKE